MAASSPSAITGFEKALHQAKNTDASDSSKNKADTAQVDDTAANKSGSSDKTSAADKADSPANTSKSSSADLQASKIVPTHLKQSTLSNEVPASGNQTKINQVDLGQGSILVAHKKSSLIHTSCGDVRVAPDSATYITQIGEEVAVYNMGGQGKNNVEIVLPGKTLSVRLGSEFVLSKSDSSGAANHAQFSDPAHLMAVPNGVDKGTIAGVSMMNVQFPVQSVLPSVPQLRQLLTSSRKDDQRLADRILKTASVIATMENR